MQSGISLFQAIEQMRSMSKLSKPFAFTYMSMNESTGLSEGVKQVNRAVLRKAAIGNDDYLQYFDLEAQQNRQCHQILLMSFNNQNVSPE